MRNSYAFETSLERLARILARQHHIEVVFEGEDAKTDGKKIYLPYFKELSEELKLDMAGFLDHETAHCKFTEFEEIKRCLSRFHKELLNAVEDCRIEREMQNEFPGTSLHLKPLREKYRGKAMENWDKFQWPVKIILAVQDAMYGTAPRLDAQTQPLFDSIKPLVDQLNDCTNTAELTDLTKKMTEIIAKEREDQKNKDGDDGEGEGKGKKENKEKGKGKGKQEKSKSGKTKDNEKDKGDQDSGDQNEASDNGEGDEGSESEGSESEGSEGEGSESGEGEAQAEGNEAGQSDESGDKMFAESVDQADSEYDANPMGVSAMVNEEIKDYIEKNIEKRAEHSHDYTMQNAEHIPYSTRHDTVTDLSRKGDARKYMSLRADVMKIVNPVKRALEKVLKVKENARWTIERERGKINTRSLATMATNKSYRTPFQEFTRTETNNVAIELLVDMSGSMRTKVYTAKQAVIVLAEALKELNIPFEVTGFHSAPERKLIDQYENAVRNGDRSPRYNRWMEKLDHYVFKGFGESNLIGIERIFSGHNNTDGESVRWAAKRLAEQKQKRKILMVFSDGMPNSEGDHRILNNDLKKAVEQIKKSGIEVIGFGIETEAVQHFYPEYVVVNDVRELPSKVMSKLAALIMRGLR